MRILSNFTDYYDWGLANGIDTNLTYVRNTKNITEHFSDSKNNILLEKYSIEERSKIDNLIKKISINNHNSTISLKDDLVLTTSYNLIIISAKPYLMIRTVIKEKNDISDKIIEDMFFYNQEEYIKYMIEIFKTRKLHYNHKLSMLNSSIEDEYKKYQKEMKRISNLLITNKNKIEELYYLIKEPILMLRRYTKNRYEKTEDKKELAGVCFNPCLKNIKFSECLLPNICFQEVSMAIGYFNDVSNNVKNEVGFSDKVILESKGFDKNSFKKRKEV